MCKSRTNTLKSNKRIQLIVLRCLCIYFVGLELYELIPIKHHNVWFVYPGEGCSPLMQCPLNTKDTSPFVHISGAYIWGMHFSVKGLKFDGLTYTHKWVKMGFTILIRTKLPDSPET